MDRPGETSTLLATLPDGSSVLSMVTGDRPLRHVYRVVSSDGTVISEQLTLGQLSDFLEGYGPEATSGGT